MLLILHFHVTESYIIPFPHAFSVPPMVLLLSLVKRLTLTRGVWVDTRGRGSKCACVDQSSVPVMADGKIMSPGRPRMRNTWPGLHTWFDLQPGAKPRRTPRAQLVLRFISKKRGPISESHWVRGSLPRISAGMASSYREASPFHSQSLGWGWAPAGSRRPWPRRGQ